ncbi:hypothetical protein [Brunnivagina elsteri]|nr:hypothetical protein [Calothrix elsteri]
MAPCLMLRFLVIARSHAAISSSVSVRYCAIVFCSASGGTLIDIG